MAETYHDFAEDARAANTRRAYRSDFADFRSFCEAEGEDALPAKPATVVRYLTAKAGALAVQTLAHRLAAIRAYHLDADLQPPNDAELRRTWSGIQRRYGRPPVKKKALLIEDLARVVDGLPTDIRGRRDRALILMGFAGAFRSCEASAIELDGPTASGAARLVFELEGVEIRLLRSKGDQLGHGDVVAIPITGTALCPVAALDAWLTAAKIRSGPVFRKIDRWGHLGAAAMTTRSACRILKAACAAAGLNARVIGFHSLRSGMASSAHRQGKPLASIQRHLRHKDPKVTAGYIQEADRFQESLATIL